MTGIVAVTDTRKVVVGGDSAAVGEYEIHTRSTRKVFQTGTYVIGFTRSWRMGQILRHLTKLPEPPGTEDGEALEHFMVAEFVPAIRESFIEHGFAKTARSTVTLDYTEEGQEVCGVFLVGVRGSIFEIREDYQVVRPGTPYAAVGRGAIASLPGTPTALRRDETGPERSVVGALYALTAHTNLSLKAKAQAALLAAEMYTQSVRGPFYFVETRGYS